MEQKQDVVAKQPIQSFAARLPLLQMTLSPYKPCFHYVSDKGTFGKGLFPCPLRGFFFTIWVVQHPHMNFTNEQI